MYIGKTSQVLSERIKEHIAEKLSIDLRGNGATSALDSAITKHPEEHCDCADIKHGLNFTILAKDQLASHLNVLEAYLIRSNSSDLSQQKNYVHMLNL